MLLFSKNIQSHRHALRSQFMVSIKTTVATTKLGPLWWVLDPLVLMGTYFFVINMVFHRGGPGYHLFALCGIVTWQSFSRAVNLCTKSLRSNASLIKQSALPMQLYVLMPPVVQSFFYLIGLGIIAVWNNSVLGVHTLAVLLLLLPMILLPFGLGLFLSVFEVHLPDTGKFMQYFLRLGFYMTPVLYSPERVYDLKDVPEFFKFLYSLNPMVHVITAVRDVLFTGKMFDIKAYGILVAVAFFIVQLGLIFFRRFAPGVPKAL